MFSIIRRDERHGYTHAHGRFSEQTRGGGVRGEWEDNKRLRLLLGSQGRTHGHHSCRSRSTARSNWAKVV